MFFTWKDERPSVSNMYGKELDALFPVFYGILIKPHYFQVFEAKMKP